MPRRFSFALVLLLILLLPGQSVAQSDLEQKKTRVEKLYLQGVQRYNRGDARKAISLWQTALGLAQTIGNRGYEGKILGALGKEKGRKKGTDLFFSLLGKLEQALGRILQLQR